MTEVTRNPRHFSFTWPELKSLFSDVIDGWSQHNAPRLGASLAFYSLLSLAPLLLVTVSIVGLVFGHSAAQRQTEEQIQALIGPAAGKAVSAFLQGAHNTKHGLIATVLGLLTVLFSASGVVIELRDALNTIWNVPATSSKGFGFVTKYLKRRLFSFGIVVAIGFLLVISLALTTWIEAIVALSASILPGEATLLTVANSLLSFLVITFLFSAIYKVMPDVPIQWRDVLLGGAVTSLLFTIGKLVLGIYLGRASYASTYGAAASIVVLIVWVYYSGQIFFFGAEFTHVFAERYGSTPTPEVRPQPARVQSA